MIKAILYKSLQDREFAASMTLYCEEDMPLSEILLPVDRDTCIVRLEKQIKTVSIHNDFDVYIPIFMSEKGIWIYEKKREPNK